MWIFLANLYAYCRHPNQIRRFWKRTGRLPNVGFPASLPERFLWRKLFDHNPVFAEVSDKLRSKAYARRHCPQLAVPRVLWTGSSVGEAPSALLRGRHVLKANHGRGFNIFLPGEGDESAIARRTRRWLSRRYGMWMGEWAYRHIRRSLFIEERIRSERGERLGEYKVHVCGGKAVWVFYLLGREEAKPAASLFDAGGMCLEDSGMPDFARGPATAPGNLAKAIEFAERLGARFDYIRCDLLEVDGILYFGEMTVYPLSGFPWNRNQEILAAWIRNWDLSRAWFLATHHSGWRGYYAEALRSRLRGRGAPDAADR